MSAIRVGMIGYGYWGPNLARNIHEMPSSKLVAIADQKDRQLDRARSKYPDVALVNNYHDFFNMDLDAVVVATPPQTHYQIASDCLGHGLHVLVEKPLTDRSNHAQALIDIAAEKDLTLMVGHTFQYNSAVLALKKLITQQELGKIYYLDTARLNLGLYQNNSNVLWDLAVHDISILLFLLDQLPISVSAQGVPCVTKGVYDVAYLNLLFPNNVTAYVHVSWLDPCKVRRVTVVGSKKMAVYNDMETEGKIKVYDKGIEAPPYTEGFGEFHYNYRTGDITIPNIRFVEPLQEECSHFIESIINHTQPRTNGQNGLQVIKILEAAMRSIENFATQEVIQW